MTDARIIAQREKCALRAALFALAVLAQLLLPAIMLRAEAIADELCVTRADNSDSSKSKLHGHEQQCAHCRLHDCSSLMPPSAGAIVVELRSTATPCLTDVLAPRSPPRCAQPPPTGPPAL